MSNKPQVTEEGRGAAEGVGSKRITIPSNVANRLGIEAGEEPAEIEFNEADRQVTFRFGDED